MEPIILPSARRHGVADEDMLHAYRNPIMIWEVEDDELEMFIGPDRSAQLLEVGVVYSDDKTPIIVHAMKARTKYLR